MNHDPLAPVVAPMDTPLCLGWGEREGSCPNPAGSSHSPLWCQECEDKRLAHLDRRFAQVSASFQDTRNDG